MSESAVASVALGIAFFSLLLHILRFPRVREEIEQNRSPRPEPFVPPPPPGLVVSPEFQKRARFVRLRGGVLTMPAEEPPPIEKDRYADEDDEG